MEERSSRIELEQANEESKKKNEYTPAHGLSSGEVKRYGRQLIMQDYGVRCQERLQSSTVLVVGCGGLGAPVLMYLASGGVGRICVVDGDVVEESNLHRQVLFGMADVGRYKVEAAADFISSRNPSIAVEEVKEMLTETNALVVMKKFRPNVILDCTDSLQASYLINRLGVLFQTPVVAGSVIGMDGQISVFLHHPRLGAEGKQEEKETAACYECLYPRAPVRTQRCRDAGVLGAVCGLIGSLQAIECIKVVTDMGADVVPDCDERVLHGRMLCFDALTATSRSVKLPTAKPECKACGTESREERESSDSSESSLAAWLSAVPTASASSSCQLDVHELDRDAISVQQFWELYRRNADQRDSNGPSLRFLVVDVRDRVQFEIASLPDSFNMPWSLLRRAESEARALLKAKLASEQKKPIEAIFVICRRGVFSKLACPRIAAMQPGLRVQHVEEGLEAVRNTMDPNFPCY